MVEHMVGQFTGVLSAVLVAVFGGLVGCGSGNTNNLSTSMPPSPPVTPTTTMSVTTFSTTSTPHGCPAPSTGNNLLDELNALYLGFDEHDSDSPNGVTIRMYDNFDMWCGVPCYGDALPDCRMSASLYNRKMMLKHYSNTPSAQKGVAVTMKRYAGIVFNQSVIETSIGKCSYMYDGATWGKKNRGCGCASNNRHCGMMDSAYNNQCCDWEPADTTPGIGKGREWNNFKEGSCHNCTDTDTDVEQCLCDSKDARFPPFKITTDNLCLWRGAAINYDGQANPKYGPSQLRSMVLQRLQDQVKNAPGEVNDKLEYWNEVIVDAEALRHHLQKDPSAVAAFMYVPGLDGQKKATDMSLQFQKDYGGKRIPVVEFNPNVDVIGCVGPFVKVLGETAIV